MDEHSNLCRLLLIKRLANQSSFVVQHKDWSRVTAYKNPRSNPSRFAEVEVLGEESVVKIRIPRGIINEDVIRAYRKGQCTSLARAISELTQWPIVFLFYSPWSKKPEKWVSRWDGKSVSEWRSYKRKRFFSRRKWGMNFLHAFVRTPSGMLLEIGGEYSETTVKRVYEEVYGPCALLEATIKDVDELPEGTFPDQAQQDLELAREYARLILNNWFGL